MATTPSASAPIAAPLKRWRATPAAGVRSRRRAQEAAGNSRHRQRHGGQHPGVGQTGKLPLHQELLQKYRPSMLELLKIQGLGPKTIALIWSAFQVSDLAGVEKLAHEGKLRDAAAHERKERAEDPQGHRGLSPHLGPLSDRRRPTAPPRN